MGKGKIFPIFCYKIKYLWSLGNDDIPEQTIVREGSILFCRPPPHQTQTGVHGRKEWREGRWQMEGGWCQLWCGSKHGTNGNQPSVNSLEKSRFSFSPLIKSLRVTDDLKWDFLVIGLVIINFFLGFFFYYSWFTVSYQYQYIAKWPGHTYIFIHTHTHTFFFFFGLFAFCRAAPMAYGSSQARGLIGAVATGLRQSHSNVRSELHLQPSP